jgi:hypothetical protein
VIAATAAPRRRLMLGTTTTPDNLANPHQVRRVVDPRLTVAALSLWVPEASHRASWTW